MARVEIKTNAQLQQMARAGVITSRALDAAVAAARPGVTTAEVNAAFERTMLELGGTSNFYGYYDYPATVCTSVNHEVVHGIPGGYVLKDGDILSIDGGAYVIDPATNRQWHGDSARTVLVGNNCERSPRRALRRHPRGNVARYCWLWQPQRRSAKLVLPSKRT